MAPEHADFLARTGFDALFAVADQVGHANGALAVEQHAVGQGVGDDGQVRALLGLVQVATGGAGAAAVRVTVRSIGPKPSCW
jgi:hypothetical protein